MGFEPTIFSLARRRSTAELRPHVSLKVDPVGFEPTISSVQRRRLPAWPRAHAGADERTRTSTPLWAADPKSAASTHSATSASIIVNSRRYQATNGQQDRQRRQPTGRTTLAVPPILSSLKAVPSSVSPDRIQHTCLMATPDLWGVTPPCRCRCGETQPWLEFRARPTHLAPGCTLA